MGKFEDGKVQMYCDEEIESVQKNQDIIEYQGKKYEVIQDYDSTELFISGETEEHKILQLKEYKKEILDKEEKEYLSAVIKPFRNKINYIIKINHFDKEEYLIIDIEKNDNLVFPFFKKNTMYKNMEVNRYYKLENLGL